MKVSKKVIYFIAIVLLVTIAAIYFGGNIYIKNKLESKLGELINTADNRLYDYKLGGLTIKLVSGSIKLSDISVKSTDYAIASVKDITNDLRMVGDFTIEEILLEGFDIQKFLKTGEIELNQFRVLNPSFTVHHNIEKNNPDTTTVLSSTLSDKFISAALGSLYIQNANLAIKEVNQKGADLNINTIHINLTESYADLETIKQSFPFNFENITLSSSGLHMDISEFYEIRSDQISFDIQSRSLAIDHFKLIPKYTHKELEKINKYNISEYQFNADRLVIEGINFSKFKNQGKIQANLVKGINNQLTVYNNKNKPFPPSKEKLLWATALRKIPLTFTIDTLKMENSTVSVHEKSEITQRVSNLFFNEMNVTVLGISTDSATIRENNFMQVNASTRFLGKGKVDLTIKVDLTSLEDNYWVTGKMGHINAVEFNQVLNPLFNANATEGEIHQTHFNFSANKYKSYGTIDMEYEDLKLELHSNHKKKKNRFSSMLVNSLVKKNNVKTRKNYKQGHIGTERDKNKSFFNYLWKSIQSGLVDTLVPNVYQQRKKNRKE